MQWSFACAVMALFIATALVLYDPVPRFTSAQSNYWSTGYWSGAFPTFPGWQPGSYNFYTTGSFGTNPSFFNYSTYNYTPNNPSIHSFFSGYQSPQTYPGAPRAGFPNYGTLGIPEWKPFNPTTPVFGWPSLSPPFTLFTQPDAFILPSRLQVFNQYRPINFNWSPHGGNNAAEEPDPYAGYEVGPVDSEEYAVYSAYFSEQHGDEDFIRIRDNTYYYPNLTLKESVPCYSGSMSVPEEVVYDFCAKNQRGYSLTDQFDMDPNSFELVAYHESYPDVFRLSRVGFNAEKTLAFFYKQIIAGCIVYGGGHVLMAKENGAWRIQDLEP